MAQTTRAISNACAILELSTDGCLTWVDISGSSQSVAGTEQGRQSGESYTMEGEGAIIRRGKREPLELAFAVVYTEVETEAYELARSIFEEVGCGGDICARWFPGGEDEPVNYEASGPLTAFKYPDLDASTAAPIMASFTMKVGSVTRDGYGVDLVLNPGFETAGAGGADVFASWDETASNGAIARTLVAGEFLAGVAACRLTAGAAVDTLVSQEIAVKPSTTYRLSFWTRGDGTAAGRYQVYDVTNAGNLIAITATGVTGIAYAYVENTFVTAVNTASVHIILLCPAVDTNIAYFDVVAVQEKA